MPYAFETKKKKLPRNLDRRVKLSLAQREQIRERYLQGGTSQRKLAAEYGVSRALIRYCIYPELLARHKEMYKERRKDGRYYDKDKHSKAIRSTRSYKQKLKNKLK